MLIAEYKSDRFEGMEGVIVTPVKSKDFIWTEEKSALLLKFVHDHKTNKVPSGLDWKLSEQSEATIQVALSRNFQIKNSKSSPTQRKKQRLSYFQ